MKKISVYRPKTIEEATDILSLHGTEPASMPAERTCWSG